MGLEWISSLFGTGNLLQGAGQLAKDLRTAITGKEPIDATKAAELAMQVQALENALTQASMDFDKTQMELQNKTNMLDAASQSLMQRGWRPFAGWICGFGLMYDFLLRPLLPWILEALGKTTTPMPPIDMATLFGLLTGMLGLGGMRTFERVQGKK